MLLSERRLALGVAAGDIEASGDAAFPRLSATSSGRLPPAGRSRPGRPRFALARHVDDLEHSPDKGPRAAWSCGSRILRAPRWGVCGRDVGFDAYTSQELAERTSGTFTVIARFQQAIAWLALAAGAVFLVTLMVLKVEERRRELAALTLIGVSRRTILSSLVLESLAVALLGAALGVGIGLFASRVINAYFRAYYRTDLVFSRVGTDVALAAVLVALPVGVVAAFVATWRLLRSRALVRGAR